MSFVLTTGLARKLVVDGVEQLRRAIAKDQLKTVGPKALINDVSAWNGGRYFWRCCARQFDWTTTTAALS